MQPLIKLIRDHEVQKIFGNLKEEGVQIGELNHFDPEKAISIMNLLASRLDKIIQLDKDVYGQPTWRSQEALSYRGFTYDEYGALFNSKIEEEEFPFYPVFNQVRKSKGGITFEKQRQALIAKYDFNEQDYIRLLCDEGYQFVLDFFSLHEQS